MRLFFIFLLLFLLDVYVFQALRLLLAGKNRQTRLWTWGIYWSVSLLSNLYLLFTADAGDQYWGKTLQTYLRTFVLLSYLAKCCVLPFLLLDDLTRAVRWVLSRSKTSPAGTAVTRSRKVTQLGLWSGGFFFGLLAYGVIRNPYRYKVFKKRVTISNLPDELNGFTIVQISDIHAGSFLFKEPLKNAIDLINQQDADVVFFTGDLVNEVADEMDHFMDVFDKIKAKRGVFSVLGNHDYGDYADWLDEAGKAAHLEKLKNIHRRLGWQLLLNSNHLLSIGQATIGIIGVENFSAFDYFKSHGDLRQAYRGVEQANLKLLLSHDPSHWDAEVTKDFQDIHMTFSGHTHGMQFGIEIPGFIKWSPIRMIYTQWAGLYRRSNQYIYVNRGLGFLGYPGRVGILPEITRIELYKG